MKNGEILHKAIKKAQANGFVLPDDDLSYDASRLNVFAYYRPAEAILIRGIIFDHKFAKAFWGEPKVTVSNTNKFMSSGTMTYGWEWQLQQMVLKKNPIKYIEQFLDA